MLAGIPYLEDGLCAVQLDEPSSCYLYAQRRAFSRALKDTGSRHSG